MKQAKHVSEDVLAMYKERASIEEEYGRRLGKLSKTFLVKDEVGWGSFFCVVLLALALG